MGVWPMCGGTGKADAVWYGQKTGKKTKVGPNDKCPCGSGKKMKKCHGR